MKINNFVNKKAKCIAAVAATSCAAVFISSNLVFSKNDNIIEPQQINLNTLKYQSQLSSQQVSSTQLTFNELPSNLPVFIVKEDTNLRERPDDESPIICSLKKADIVEQISASDSKSYGWIKIKINGQAGYVKLVEVTEETIYREEQKKLYTTENACAYTSPDTNAEAKPINFNEEVQQTRANGNWTVIEYENQEYYIPTEQVNEDINFKETDTSMFTLDENTTLFSDAYKTEESSEVSLYYNEPVHVVGINDDTVQLNIDGDEYYASYEDLSYFRYIEEEESYNEYYNVNYYNTDIINRLNTYYDPSISEDFYINNDTLRELVDEYLNNAREEAGENATPGEIVYYAYIALMDNSYYSYNTYCAEVRKKFGLDDNSGSYRAAAILDHDICRGACENYACAMTAFLRTMGFDAEIVGGNIGSKGHYWCQVGDLVFDAQVDDSNKSYGLRFGRTSDEIGDMGSSRYYIYSTKETSSKLKLYNNFGT